MLKISLYQDYCVLLCEHINPHNYRTDQSYRTYRRPTSATGGRLSQRQEPCIPYALPSGPLEIIGFDIEKSWRTDRNDTYISQFVGEAFRIGRHPRIRNPSRSWAQAYNGLLPRESSTGCHRERQTKREESHICTEGHVPHGWQFPEEEVLVPSQKSLRLNIFGMIDRNNRYDGFSTTENITADKIADFLDRLSFRIKKNTFVILDNARVHRCKLMRELRPIWEKRGLFLFFLPPYSPYLDIAETLWRILKGK